MTKIIEIDCSKWRKVIGISLWFGATVGLGFGLYGVLNYIQNHGWQDCYLTGNQNDGYCIYDKNHIVFTVILFAAAIGSNFFNYVGIWKVCNSKYEWLEIRCKQ